MPPQQNRVTEDAKYTYSLLGNVFEKQIKKHRVKQVEVLQSLASPGKKSQLMKKISLRKSSKSCQYVN